MKRISHQIVSFPFQNSKKSTKHSIKFLVDSNNLNPIQQKDLANSPLAQFLNGNNIKNGLQQQPKDKVATVNGNKSTPSGFQAPQQTSNGFKETKLITPAMLSAKSSSVVNGNGEKKQAEPLNRNQLVQALKYLIDNDDEFSKKVHEAYLKSIAS